MPVRFGAPRLRVRVVGSRTAIDALLREHPPACERVARVRKQFAIELTLGVADVAALPRRGLAVELLYDLDEAARASLADEGRGNRFSDGRRPRGVGQPAKAV